MPLEKNRGNIHFPLSQNTNSLPVQLYLLVSISDEGPPCDNNYLENKLILKSNELFWVILQVNNHDCDEEKKYRTDQIASQGCSEYCYCRLL